MNPAKNFIITVSGTPGSGKSTLAKKLAKRLQAKRIYVGEIRRQLAKDKQMTLEELNQYGLIHPETDVDVDRAVAQAARQLAKKNIVIVEGRMQYHWLPESIKLYIKVSLAEGAKRIWLEVQNKRAMNKRNEGQYRSLAEVKAKIQKREKNDRQRYQKYYRQNHTDQKHFDLVLNTTNLTPEQGLEKILKFLKKKGISGR